MRKIYTPEYKAAAVKLVLDGKQTVPEAAKSLGLGKAPCTNGSKKPSQPTRKIAKTSSYLMKTNVYAPN